MGSRDLAEGHQVHELRMAAMKEDYAKLYTELHQKDKAFAGRSIRTYVNDIAALVEKTGAKRLLDFGSGKGFQYLQYRVHEQWGGILPYCYDVGVRQLSEKPEGKFDGVICTDMMEHIAEADVDEVLADILSFTSPKAFAFFAIACRPSTKKKLSDGRDVHLCIKSPSWWNDRLNMFSRPGLEIVARFDGDGE
jgi:hypothetical protein